MNNEEVKLKQKEYKNYIDEHIKNVQKSFETLRTYKDKTITKLIFSNPQLVEDIKARILVHDKSKYSKEEFEPYRKNFFPINDEEKENNKEDFDKAWEHHWQNNDHHWQNRENTETLNRAACIEQILDWMAMGIKFNDRCWEYYDNNKENIHMNEIETDYIETILDAIKEEDLEKEIKQEMDK